MTHLRENRLPFPKGNATGKKGKTMYLITNSIGIACGFAESEDALAYAQEMTGLTGHNHYVVEVKPEGAVREFCRDTYGTVSSYVFKANTVAEAMNLSIRETYEWLYNAVHYNFLTQKREDTFVWKGDK